MSRCINCGALTDPNNRPVAFRVWDLETGEIFEIKEIEEGGKLLELCPSCTKAYGEHRIGYPYAVYNDELAENKLRQSGEFKEISW